MKVRLPASLSLLAVPVLCLTLLGLAWFLVRGGGQGADEPMPALRLLAEEGLKPSLVGLVAAFERRVGVRAELSHLPGKAIEGLLREGSSHDLLLLSEEGAPPRAFADAPVAAIVGDLRVLSLPGGTVPEDAARFLDFLKGSFAREILEQGTARPLVPPQKPDTES
jgi:hypothetical protein